MEDKYCQYCKYHFPVYDDDTRELLYCICNNNNAGYNYHVDNCCEFLELSEKPKGCPYFSKE